ncbi:prepilin-type N-terminal cleavage/methylation domain-containing protein [Solidesulfovibrio sp.]
MRRRRLPLREPPSAVPSATRCGGFTLIEILAVLMILGTLAVVAVVHYASLLGESKSRGASTLVAAAQSQLSLEFARRATAGLPLDIESQPVCEWVVITSPEVVATIACAGTLDDTVAITATIDTASSTGNWVSPLFGGS